MVRPTATGRVTTGTACGCRNHLGMPKALYEDRADALTMANRKTQHRGRKFSVYPCPSGLGWHVTGRPQRPKGAASSDSRPLKLDAGGSRNKEPAP